MTNKEFKHLFMEAVDAKSWEMYFAQCASDPAFAQVPDEIYEEYVENALQNIWTAANISIKEMVATSGLSMTDFADRFLIPVRTLQDWIAKGNQPTYVTVAYAELCGIVQIDRACFPHRKVNRPIDCTSLYKPYNVYLGATASKGNYKTIFGRTLQEAAEQNKYDLVWINKPECDKILRIDGVETEWDSGIFGGNGGAQIKYYCFCSNQYTKESPKYQEYRRVYTVWVKLTYEEWSDDNK